MARFAPSKPESQGSRTLVPWKLWSTLVCVQLLVMVDSTQAVRMLQQQASQQIRLQAFHDDTNNPCHAPAVKSFLVSDGTWVDCIPIEGQIAAHHPALKDHIIQMTPSSPRRSSSQQRSSELHPQLFAREHGGCPKGSIPVLRNDPFRSLRKKGSPLQTQADSAIATESSTPHRRILATGTETHEHAVASLPYAPKSYTGAHSILSVNGPELGDPTQDFSLSQLWIMDGLATTFSTIEVGWQKYPALHQGLNDGDPNAPHLFIFWTNDNYASGGPGSCYNINANCAGFVQTDQTWVMGGAMPSYTTLAQNASTESEVEIEVNYSATDSNWYLHLNNVQVGYWPSSIFDGRLQGTAEQVQWGGEVMFFKDASTTTHSLTTMGSGAFPSAGYPVAAYHKDITYTDTSGAAFKSPLVSDLIANQIVAKPLCYNIAINYDPNSAGTYFYFGGPGGNDPACVG